MRKIGFSLIAFVSLAGAASAADLPARASAAAPASMLGANWSGFYGGLHGGYGWGGDAWLAEVGVSTFGDRSAGRVFKYDPKGWMGGVQAGYNWQFNSFVVGLEGAGTIVDVRTSALSVFGVRDDVYKTQFSTILSGAARGGFTFGDALVYGKVGYALVETKRKTVDLIGSTGENGSTVWHAGAVLGAGVEYAFTRNLSAALEYNYYALDKRRSAYASGDVDRFDPNLQTVTLRLNYRFGGSGPVVARY